MAVKPKPRPRTKTDEKTLRGRPVWIDETGEITGKKGAKYSEVTTTIPFGTQFITAPTIDENGNRLSDDEVKQKLKDNQGKDFITGEKLPVFSSEEKAVEYAKWRSSTMSDEKAIKEGFPEETFPDLPDDTIKQKEEKDSFLDYLLSPSKHGVLKKPKYNKGGSIMNEQMQMAFMNEGGLKDDGMDKDPVSGNEVPSGSMAKEVRDDIPAQLSEGEYVVPADVVRYYGVKFFEDLRETAKIGLQEMEMNGRIGGEPVPAGGPINDEELSPQEMQAIQEMMGMAEGGTVNMYKQQQDLYTAPNPAIGNTVEMNQGGQVSGYQAAGDVASQTEQGFLQQGQQAQQRGFVGFPLGATIFPSEKTGQTVLGPVGTQVATTGAIDAAATGTAGTDTSALTTVTLYGPNGEIVTLTLPTDIDRYNQLLSEGYTTEMPVAGEPVVKGSDDDDGDDEVKTDPNAWMDKFNYDDPENLLQQTSQSLTKIPFGGVIGAFANGTKAAQAAANIIIAKALGEDTTTAEAELKKFRKETGIDMLGGLINGDKLARDIAKTQFVNLDRNTVDLQGNPIFKDDADYQAHVTEVRQNTATSSAQAAKDTKDGVYKPEGIDVALLKKDDASKEAARARAKSRRKSRSNKAAMERAQKSGASSTKSISGLRKAYEKEGGTWATGGRAKGGLMTKGKNKK